MTTQQNKELPIVSFLEKKKELYEIHQDIVENEEDEYTLKVGAETIKVLLPDIRTLEQSSIDKAKEEATAYEKERIVGILEQMSENIFYSVTDGYSTNKEKVISQYKIEAIEEAIELINNQ